MKLFFSVGEPSGDLHGANLIRELAGRDPQLDAVGFGGPRMAAAGCRLLHDMSDLAVMGLLPVLAKLPQFFQLRAAAKRYFQEQRPDAVVLIDYPGFNWHIARLAKERGIPVFYYGLPQLWAWASWRVKRVRQYVDHALCKLPFEEAWFRERGCRATYIGHPYFDELRTRKLDRNFLSETARSDSRLVTLLPGSRTSEVKNNLPLLLQAAAKIWREVPEIHFAIASYNEKQSQLARQMAVAHPALPLTIQVGRTPELIEAAEVCLACSGSVSLELLYHAKPAVMVYKVNWLKYQVVQSLVRVRYMTLVNLLAADQLYRPGRELYEPGSPDHANVLYPEYPTWQDKSTQVARHAIEWLTDETARQALIARLVALRERVAAGGASAAAADYIWRNLLPSTLLDCGNESDNSAIYFAADT